MYQLFADLLLVAHIFCIIIWLGGDLVVFGLSLSLLNRDLPIAVRIDRAQLVEFFDRFVVYSYLVTLPLGVLLAWWRGWWPMISVPWLMTKLLVFGVLIFLAVVLIVRATGSIAILKQIETGAEDVEVLETRLRKGVQGLAPWAVAIHLGILIIIFITVQR